MARGKKKQLSYHDAGTKKQDPEICRNIKYVTLVIKHRLMQAAGGERENGYQMLGRPETMYVDKPKRKVRKYMRRFQWTELRNSCSLPRRPRRVSDDVFRGHKSRKSTGGRLLPVTR